jgi:ketosteroid isomerase-like protein
MKFTLTFLFSLASMLAFSQKNETAEALIRQNIADFSKNLVAGNIDALVAAYTPDAKIFPNGHEILQGESLRNYWTPPADRKSRTSYHRIMPEEIRILGNEAYDWGYYEGKTLGEDGQETAWKGKYVIIWKEVAPGVWKIYLDIWNRVP